jgi:hypothetical protein
MSNRDQSDSVLRAFSVLFLAEIVHNDNKNHFSTSNALILKAGIFAERPARISRQGWAHALAHRRPALVLANEISKKQICGIF